MPAESKAQARLMQGVAHGMKPRKGGPSKKVAKDFVAATPKGSYKKLPERKGKGGY